MSVSAARVPARCRTRCARRWINCAEMARRKLLTLLAFLCAMSSSEGALDPAALRNAAAYSGKQRGASLLVVQQGKTLLEQYPDGGGAGVARKIYSGTKAFWNLAALAAAEDGLLNLDERVAETIPAWRNDP